MLEYCVCCLLHCCCVCLVARLRRRCKRMPFHMPINLPVYLQSLPLQWTPSLQQAVAPSHHRLSRHIMLAARCSPRLLARSVARNPPFRSREPSAALVPRPQIATFTTLPNPYVLSCHRSSSQKARAEINPAQTKPKPHSLQRHLHLRRSQPIQVLRFQSNWQKVEGVIRLVDHKMVRIWLSSRQARKATSCEVPRHRVPVYRWQMAPQANMAAQLAATLRIQSCSAPRRWTRHRSS